MSPAGDIGADEGGEAPCFAHLLDEPEPALDDVVTARLARSEGGCRAGTGTDRQRRESTRDSGGSPPRA